MLLRDVMNTDYKRTYMDKIKNILASVVLMFATGAFL